jgi:16S rRNA (cytosine967-C5)-methyltransferase
LQGDHPTHWQEILQAAQSAAPMTLRVSDQYHDVAAYLQVLEGHGIAAKAVGEAGVQLTKAVPVQLLPGFAQGHVSVQDAAAQLAAPLLLKGLKKSNQALRLLDACAAPAKQAICWNATLAHRSSPWMSILCVVNEFSRT